MAEGEKAMRSLEDFLGIRPATGSGLPLLLSLLTPATPGGPERDPTDGCGGSRAFGSDVSPSMALRVLARTCLNIHADVADFERGDREVLEKAVREVFNWLSGNEQASDRDIGSKPAEFEGIVNRIKRKACSGGEEVQSQDKETGKKNKKNNKKTKQKTFITPLAEPVPLVRPLLG